MTAAWLYDGEVALRREVTIAPAGDDLLVVDTEGPEVLVGRGQLRFVEARPDANVYRRADRMGWRLVVPVPIAEPIAARLPAASRYGGWIDRVGLWRAAAAGLAVSAVVMFVIWSLPHWVAPFIPDRWMKAYGNALVGDFGGRFCAGPGGQAALDRLVARLAPGVTPPTARIVNYPIVNAAALPGGDIIVFRELVAEAKGPDELAGVLAHEIAHVRHRDVAEAMVRELGFGLVIGAFGGSVGGNAHMLASLSYSRDAEARADAGAIESLRRANISPAPTAAFFDRLGADEDAFDGAIVYLSTHPLSKGRAARFHRAALPGATPALTRDEWDALADICHNDPAQRDDE